MHKHRMRRYGRRCSAIGLGYAGRGGLGPGTPTSLTVTAQSSAAIALSWTAAPGATTYNVYQGTSAGNESATPVWTGLTTTTALAIGLSASTTYYFTVKGVSGGVSGAASNEASGTTSARSTLSLDHFTGTNGTNLTAHTMDTGSGWTAGTNAFTIQTNRARNTTAPAIYTADPGNANVNVTCIFKASVQNGNNGVICRFQDTSSYWLVNFDSTTFYLTDVAAGDAGTSAGSFAINTDHTIAIYMIGALMAATINGGNAIYTDAATNYQTSTKAGIRGHAGTCDFDDFQVTT